MCIPPLSQFTWPNGLGSALSLTFDDGLKSQLDVAVPIFAEFGIRATFYVLPKALRFRTSRWRNAIAAGHEIGNHTVMHPCSESYAFARKNPLENYTLHRMEQEELLEANRKLLRMVGVTPSTFAYPCGQTMVGRESHAESYVGLVRRHFAIGRGYRIEHGESPETCDLAQVKAVPVDGRPWEELLTLIEANRRAGGWLIFAAHGMGKGEPGSMDAAVLREVCAYVADTACGIWTDTVANVGRHVRECREKLPAASA